MESLILVLGPVVTMALTSAAKIAIPVIASHGKWWVRLVVAVLAFCVTVTQVALVGGELDPSSAETLSLVILNTLGAFGTNSLKK